VNGNNATGAVGEIRVTGDDPREFSGRDAMRAWLDRLAADYAEDVQWSAPRRGVTLRGRQAVIDYLAGEYEAMDDPRVCILRQAAGQQAQRFHEFTIRFRLATPGIEGVAYPPGADVELERLRVSTYDETCRIVVETCIETWTWLSAPAAAGSLAR
jgi:hypothetical protein